MQVPGAPTELADIDRLDRSLVKGVAWTGAAKWSTQVLTWATTFLLARLLTPGDFGIVALAAVYIGFVALVNEMGIGTAIITFRDLSSNEISQINVLALLLGVAGFVVSCLLAIPLGAFFGLPDLPRVIFVMSLSFLVSPLRTVPIGLLQRDFRFRLLAHLEAGQAVVQALMQAGFALLGFRYWSLILGDLVALGAAATVVVILRRPGYAVPRLRALERVTKFTRHMLAARITWYLYSNADFLVAGKVLGQASLGMYKLAWAVSTSPLQKITELVTRVTPAVFSAVKGDLAALRRYLLSITEAMALVTFPLTIGLSLVADDFVRVALGAKWEGVIMPLRVLAWYVSIRTISTIPSQVLMVIGETRFMMRNGFFAVVLLPAAFLAGSYWGTTGVAAGWIFAYPAVVLPVYSRLFARIEMTASAYLRCIWPALSSSLIMSAAVLLLRVWLPADAPPILRLVLQVATGAAAYCGFALGAHRERVVRFRDTVRKVRA